MVKLSGSVKIVAGLPIVPMVNLRISVKYVVVNTSVNITNTNHTVKNAMGLPVVSLRGA